MEYLQSRTLPNPPAHHNTVAKYAKHAVRLHDPRNRRRIPSAALLAALAAERVPAWWAAHRGPAAVSQYCSSCDPVTPRTAILTGGWLLITVAVLQAFAVDDVVTMFATWLVVSIRRWRPGSCDRNAQDPGRGACDRFCLLGRRHPDRPVEVDDDPRHRNQQGRLRIAGDL
ncbi:hypothetical protein ACFYO1_03305 [Nocardia sp. NPDC006044]|uniref:hypothetical protein n=1 Tax=Nocardia sp. NPDC006044 TaxID=3364306 RepID=UPI0036797AA4